MRGGQGISRIGDGASRAGDPALEPPPGNPKFPHLDGIRGLACLAILGFHGVPYTATSTGPVWVHIGATLRLALPFFFFLSAFLLYRPFVAARVTGAPRPGLATFWWRRVLRIVPAYWVALTLAAVWPGVGGVFGSQAWRYYGFVYVYRPGTVGGGLIPCWTLCVDMTFYLVLPFAAAALDRLWRRVGPERAVAAELGVLGLVWAAAMAYWFVFVSSGSLSEATLDVREWNLVANLDWFALGMALAVLSVADLRAPTALTRLLARRGGVEASWVLAALTFTAVAVWYFEISPPLQHLLAGLACVAVFAPATLVGRRGRLQQSLAHPRVAWLGVTSYGIYLYHGPVLTGLARLHLMIGRGLTAYLTLVGLAIPLSVALSVASYYLLERPILRRKPGRAASPAQGVAEPVAATAAPVEAS